MSVTVSPVESGKDLHAFVTFPWTLYADDPLWVPPLIADVKKIFNPKKHPFYKKHMALGKMFQVMGDEEDKL